MRKLLAINWDFGATGAKRWRGSKGSTCPVSAVICFMIERQYSHILLCVSKIKRKRMKKRMLGQQSLFFQGVAPSIPLSGNVYKKYSSSCHSKASKRQVSDTLVTAYDSRGRFWMLAHGAHFTVAIVQAQIYWESSLYQSKDCHIPFSLVSCN